MTEWSSGGLLTHIHSIPDSTVLHQDDPMMTVFTKWRSRQSEHVARSHLAQDSFETERGQVMALIDNLLCELFCSRHEAAAKNANVPVLAQVCYAASMSLSISIPDDVAAMLGSSPQEREQRAREAIALELYRQGKIPLRVMGELAGVGQRLLGCGELSRPA